VLAVGKVLLAALGLSVFLQLIFRRVIGWIADRLLRVDLPEIPWPDIDPPSLPWPDFDLPSVPWPDVNLPDLALPGWLLLAMATAKYWIAILIAIGVAAREVRRRTGNRPEPSEPPRGSPKRTGAVAVHATSDREEDGTDHAHC